jgi:hypothetical protein
MSVGHVAVIVSTALGIGLGALWLAELVALPLLFLHGWWRERRAP